MLYHRDFFKIPSRSITVQHLVSRLLALTLACRFLDLDSLLLLRYCSITTKLIFCLSNFFCFPATSALQIFEAGQSSSLINFNSFTALQLDNSRLEQIVELTNISRPKEAAS
ncbi:hypothetical protein FPOAC2_12245 [Fusarium poae]